MRLFTYFFSLWSQFSFRSGLLCRFVSLRIIIGDLHMSQDITNHRSGLVHSGHGVTQVTESLRSRDHPGRCVVWGEYHARSSDAFSACFCLCGYPLALLPSPPPTRLPPLPSISPLFFFLPPFQPSLSLSPFTDPLAPFPFSPSLLSPSQTV